MFFGGHGGHSEVWRDGQFLNAGGDRDVLAVVQSPKPQNGQRIGTKFGRPLVDCYFVHFKYLGCWCICTVCEENDIETEPLYFVYH